VSVHATKPERQKQPGPQSKFAESDVNCDGLLRAPDFFQNGEHAKFLALSSYVTTAHQNSSPRRYGKFMGHAPDTLATSKNGIVAFACCHLPTNQLELCVRSQLYQYGLSRF
jgi:hypothetical protein